MREADISEFKRKGLMFQYWFTVLVATPLGLAIMLFPGFTKRLLKFREQDQLMFGISGSVYFAFGLLSILGLREPLKWSPILMLQFLYKVAWFVGVIGLMARRGELELESSIMMIVGYAAFIAGDLLGVPFGYVLKGER